MMGSLDIISELTGPVLDASQQQQACAIGCETAGVEITSMGAAGTGSGAGAGALQQVDAGAGAQVAGVGAGQAGAGQAGAGQAGAGQVVAATAQAGWQLLFCLQLSFFKSQPADAGLALIKTIRHTTIVQRE